MQRTADFDSHRGQCVRFLVPICYAWSRSTFGSIEPALQFYVGLFLVMLGVTAYTYLRRGSRMARAGV